MKHYCLKPEAKNKIRETLAATVVSIIIVFLGFGTLFLPIVLMTGYPEDTLIMIFGYIGIVSWTGIFYLMANSIKNWLQSNIIEC